MFPIQSLVQFCFFFTSILLGFFCFLPRRRLSLSSVMAEPVSAPLTPPGPVAQPALFDEIDDMFDLAAPPIQKPAAAQLIPSENAVPFLETIVLYTDDTLCTVGRSKELIQPFRIEHSEKISGKHCQLLLDPGTLRVHLKDTSTNGTFVNGTRLGKKRSVELHSGDVVALTKPDSLDGRIEFLFQRLKEVTSLDELAHRLTCRLCSSIFLRPCRLSPCMHMFCGDCISAHVDSGSGRCPQCEESIRYIRPVHDASRSVDHLWNLQPMLKPSEGEMAERAARDTIPPGGRVLRSSRPETEEALEEADDGEPSAVEVKGETGVRGPLRRVRFKPFFTPRITAVSFQCRHCLSPSPIDGFQCCAATSSAPHEHSPAHLQCKACWHPFPDRPLCGRPLCCFVCATPYCHLYYAGAEGGCSAVGLNGEGSSLKPLDEYSFDYIPHAAFAGNAVEYQRFQEYLSFQDISPLSVWISCLQHFREGAWRPDVRSIGGEITPDKPVCSNCARLLYAGLLFHYRRAIPDEDLPDEEIAALQECWNGIQCRTQFQSAVHAEKFNHICYQEKRKE